MLIDTHCHLDFDDFAPELDAVVARALAAGVKRMVTISTHVRQFDKIRALAEKYDSVFCSVGTHPLSAREEPGITVEELVTLAQHPKVVAIGEVGLDYHYDYDGRDIQKQSFLRHIEAARQTGLPVIIHARQADEDMEAILREEMEKGAFRFILHCYSSGMKLAKTGVELGGFISFSGILTFKSAPEIREIAALVPHDRLLVETDAPYLAPVPFRGKRNEPAYVVETAAVLAGVLGMPLDEMAAVTTGNAYQVYHKMTPPEEG
ncbi:MAG: Hydrolase, TatD family [Candidatus Tokpelaia hoelldobleri]|uniref:Hydrolase, TatD family n=1 Tax=Candidatus Tokpelaia hoelldobleri TaxID=1902579 RepID=A0A1U9JUR0_9HYPH|nr:MAG: Hydrolase, TatD family [Candidatus Tokpelaia hoelldoblerii]